MVASANRDRTVEGGISLTSDADGCLAQFDPGRNYLLSMSWWCYPTRVVRTRNVDAKILAEASFPVNILLKIHYFVANKKTLRQLAHAVQSRSSAKLRVKLLSFTTDC